MSDNNVTLTREEFDTLVGAYYDIAEALWGLQVDQLDALISETQEEVEAIQNRVNPASE